MNGPQVGERIVFAERTKKKHIGIALTIAVVSCPITVSKIDMGFVDQQHAAEDPREFSQFVAEMSVPDGA